MAKSMLKKPSKSANKNGSQVEFKLGDMVRILQSGWPRGRIVELRGPLGPGGIEIYRVRVRRKPTTKDIEVRADQLEPIPAASGAN
jgi:hypothetical protein